MQNVKKPQLARKLRQDLLQIKEHTTFAQTFKIIKSDKQIDIVWVKKPKAAQMWAVLLHRLGGQKFRWIQNFENPPAASLWSKILISQADRIIVSSRRDYNKLKRFGINPQKVRIEK